jgi:hypothetical protein
MTDTGTIIAASASIVSALGVVFTIISKRKSRQREDLHESMTLWVLNGGGRHIRAIVREENLTIITRLDKHESTEPQRWREAMEAYEEGR